MKARTSVLLLLALLKLVDGTTHSQLPFTTAMRPERPVVRGLNQDGVKDNWKPIRIKAFYDHSIERLSPNQQRLIKCVLVSAAVEWLQKVLVVRPVTTSIRFERSCQSYFHYLVNGQSYCPEACAKQTKCGSFSTIPEEHLSPCRVCSRTGKCKQSSDPDPQLNGVHDTDFVLYVSVWDDLQCRGLASGGHCQQEEDYGRPIAGYLNVCKFDLEKLDSSKGTLDYAIQRILHQLIHALVFSPQLYAFYRDSSGNHSGSMHEDPIAQIDGSFLVSDQVLNHTVFDWSSRVKMRHRQSYLVTPAVKRVVQEHFNCSSLPGALVEDFGGPGTVHRHWEERLFADDMLSASQPADKGALPSVLTLALFEDSGWYKVDYNYSVPLKWGKSKGCAFVNDSCLGWIKYTQSRRLDTAPFCTATDAKTGRMSCSTNRKAVAKCNLINYPIQLPLRYQYFNTTAGGATPYADFCPIFEPFMSCDQRANSAKYNYLLETFGVNTHCIEHDSNWRILTVSGKSVPAPSSGAGCYNVRCGWWRGREVTYISLGTQSSSSKEYLCKRKGQRLSIKQKSGFKQYIGSIICPGFDEVCQNLRCLNHCSQKGTCSNGKCFCHPGYFGEDCSQHYGMRLLDCSNVKCLNGQACLQGDCGFQCDCPENRKGDFCEKTKIIPPCLYENCSGHGECYYGLDGMSPTCGCNPGYTGTKCEERIDYCSQLQFNPCKNGGTCQNGNEGYLCLCTQFYSGDHCEVYKSPCHDNPCQHGGTCIEDDNSPRGFRCQCTPKWKGTFCKTYKVCTSVTCTNGGTCMDLTSSDDRNWVCSCPSGYNGRMCENRDDPCDSAPCLNGGNCSSLEDGTFICKCKEGYAGDLCDQEGGPCVPSPCLNGGKCSESGSNSAVCNCTADFVGKHCEIPAPCKENPCLNDGTCMTRQDGSFYCVCQPGWISKLCNVNDPCHHNPCHNGANCTVEAYTSLRVLQALPTAPIKDSFRPHCTCAEGYYGTLCQLKKPCIPNPCENGGQCINLSPLEYTCQCLDGYLGVNCSIEDPCASHPCLNNATCIPYLNGSFACSCSEGFTSQHCEQKLPCIPNPCHNGGTCVNERNGTVECKCTEGYTSTQCELRDPCHPNPCLNGGICVGTPYPATGNDRANLSSLMVKCDCDFGYVGDRCETFDPCFNFTCLNGGTCVVSMNRSTCNCPDDFEGEKCQLFRDPCISHPCMHNGTCHFHSPANFTCECVEPYTGSVCQDVDYCSASPCSNNGTCIALDNGTLTCLCPPHFTGQWCESEEDPCSPNPCGKGTCAVNERGTFNCSCPVHLTGPLCNETLPYRPDICKRNASICSNNGICSSTVEYPYYRCSCMQGFAGDHCETHKTSICQEQPCLNGGRCVSYTQTWRICICKPGYTGDNCSVYVPCQSKPCQHGECMALPNADYKCTCELGYTGRNCTEQAVINSVEFSGSPSYIEFKPSPHQSINELNVTISFRSLRDAGPLLHIEDTATSRLISLVLYKDRLQLRIMKKNKLLVFASTTRQPLSNEWYIANLFLSSTKAKVSISGNARMRTKTLSPSLLSTFNYTYFSLGGLRTNTFSREYTRLPFPITTGFYGCISHVILRDRLQDLTQALVPSTSAGISTCQLDPCGGGCQAKEVCSVQGMRYICQSKH